jgi:hypothetical protein
MQMYQYFQGHRVNKDYQQVSDCFPAIIILSIASLLGIILQIIL